MTERQPISRILVTHFFRRFFDNDTLQADGDTQTTVVRAVSAVAVPGLMFAFFLQTSHPQRTLWGSIEDQYFFVLFSFVVMGLVAVFEGQMLFPDRLDFLVLTPLSLKPLQILAAKALALFGFLALFLVGTNVFGALLLPAVSKGAFFHHIYAHAVAVLLAGAFASLSVLALGGLLLCLLDSAAFRVASPILQMLATLVLVLFLVQYARYDNHLDAFVAAPFARWIPPFWFLGVYENLLRGDAAPPFALPMARIAVRATLAVAAIAAATYPVAWTRMREMAIEGEAGGRSRPSSGLRPLMHRVIRRPGERAVFHFIGQTLTRNSRYQVYLAMYCGTGLALALASSVSLRVVHGVISPALSVKGLHAILPLLLFWIVAGLRIAFSFPLHLPAGWIFRISGVKISEAADAARRWAFWCALAATVCIVKALHLIGWDGRHLLVQIVCGLCLCLLLSDGFFFSAKSVPFNQPRMPGRVNFPLMMALWGAFPAYVLEMVDVESGLEKNLGHLLPLILATAVLHGAIRILRSGPEEVEEEYEGYEGEFQLLNLS